MIKWFQKNKKTLFSFVIGVVVAVGIFLLLQNPWVLDVFQANILSVADKEVLTQEQRDIWYKTINNELDVYVSKRDTVLDSLELEILFSQWDVNFDFWSMIYQWSFERIDNGDGVVILKFDHLGDIDYGQSLFELPFVWDANKVLIGEVRSWNTSLSVWNLNVKNSH